MLRAMNNDQKVVSTQSRASKGKPASTAKRGKYAKARVDAKQTYNSLRALGYGMGTIRNADNGKLPRHPAVRAAYLAAIKFTEAKP